MKAFFTAMMFLTRIPLPNFHSSKEDWYKSAIYYPIVGLILGCLLLIVHYSFEKIFPISVVALFIVFFWIWITGGLHLDGWIDLHDAVGSNRNREQMLEIMKDSRIGAMGAISVICLIIGKIVAVFEIIQQLPVILILFPPLFARVCLVGAIKFGKYRQDGGLGTGLHTYLSPSVILGHVLLVIGITYFFLGLTGILLFLLTILFSGLFLWNIYRKLKVLTGDCYGACIEWSETVTLFLAIFLWELL
jgi:adenosylcobinamide-GDP ribazoletransferase